METLLKRHGMAPLGDDTREDRAYCEGFNNALKLGDEAVAQLQEKIAALSSNSEHRVAHYATHLFNDTDPWIVIDEIKLLIKRLPKQ